MSRFFGTSGKAILDSQDRHWTASRSFVSRRFSVPHSGQGIIKAQPTFSVKQWRSGPSQTRQVDFPAYLLASLTGASKSRKRYLSPANARLCDHQLWAGVTS